MNSDEAEDPPPLVARVLQFDRHIGELPEDYRDNCDEQLCEELAKSLASHLRSFADSNNVAIDIQAEGNRITLERDDGTELNVTVFGNEIFELTRWPNPADAAEQGSLRFDLAPELESDAAVAISRHYVMNGTIDNA